MECLPAIDLRGGRCVRLLRGDFAEETVYGDPLELARAFVEAGAPALHLVDLDAARGAEATNAAVVGQLLSALPVPVQVGGGVRDASRATALLDLGAARVIVGTWAVESPEAVRELAARHPARIAIGLDHRRAAGGGAAREVALRGWSEGGGTDVAEVLDVYAGSPLGAVVVTNIALDGTLEGPDLEGYAELLGRSTLPLVASGGVGTVADLVALRRLEVGGRRLAGAVIGRALLSGAMTIAEAVDACAP
jgi:phosphoribosylformimino-5-aminoimidazole carboxamide ribotide isomerase